MDTVMAIDMVITTVTAQDTTKVPTENRVGINGSTAFSDTSR